MKICAYTALHYGSEYLAYAIRSIIDHVDEYIVLYSPVGSHGHRTELPCPDSREQLLQIAMDAAGKKLRWYDGNWTNEGQQRMSIHEVAPDADVILVLDSDEIWPDALIEAAIPPEITPLTLPRTLRLPIIHYWRSFYRAVLHDPAYPTRVIYPPMRGAEYTVTTRDYGVINHMGYAQSADVVWYKQFTHGHKSEWRKDIDWFRDRFQANAQADCHPVGSEYWNPEAVNPTEYMPEFMRSHPNWNKEMIE